MHLRNVFAEGELRPEATVQNFLTARQEGARQVSRNPGVLQPRRNHLRCLPRQSGVATQLRIWATQRLREYIVKGFALDDERLKNPDVPFDYWPNGLHGWLSRRLWMR